MLFHEVLCSTSFALGITPYWLSHMPDGVLAYLQLLSERKCGIRMQHQQESCLGPEPRTDQWLLRRLLSVITLHVLNADSPQLLPHHHRFWHVPQVQQCQA